MRPVGESYIGRRLRRREDPDLLRGAGRYTGDLQPIGLAHLAVVRAPVAHARVDEVDLEAAGRLPGVLLVLSAAGLARDRTHLHDFAAAGFECRHRPLLAGDHVRYVGEPVAVVVAESEAMAADAAHSVSLALQPLPALPDVDAAIAADAVQVHAGISGNLAGRMSRGYGDIGAAFSNPPVLVSASLWMARVIGAAMEPRVVLAAPESGGGLTVHSSTQWVFGVRDEIAALLDLDPALVTVIAPQVGGGFGAKGVPYQEEVLVALAALRLHRPVRWVSGRSDDLAAGVMGHGARLDLELAAAPDGRLLGLRGRILHDLGAYSARSANRTESMLTHLMSAYRLPALAVDVDFVYTNSAPAGFIRGGGRPVGNFGIERMMDRLAERLGLDPIEVRRRNLVRREQMPYDTGFPAEGGTIVYDGGDYAALLAAAAAALSVERQRRGSGLGIGFGVACCVESTGLGQPEPASIDIQPDGGVRLRIGATPHGQGHETMAAQVLADRLGWPIDLIQVVAGDSRAVTTAAVTAASRTALETGNAVAAVGKSARAKLLHRAGDILEARPEDLDLTASGAAVRGVSARSVTLAEMVGDGLHVAGSYQSGGRAYSSGCHAAVIQLDPETGAVSLLRYVIAHDTGVAINPLLVEGQLVGGWVHGVGYALFEEALVAADGALLTASFLDYSIPGPPEIGIAPELIDLCTPGLGNPEGFRGAGEAGTIPAPAAIASAIEDALRRLGHPGHVDRIPASPLEIHRLIRSAIRTEVSSVTSEGVS